MTYICMASVVLCSFIFNWTPFPERSLTQNSHGSNLNKAEKGDICKVTDYH